MQKFVRSISRVVVVLRSPIHSNELSEYNGMLYRTSNRVLNNGIKVIILICMDGTSQYHHHHFSGTMPHLDDIWYVGRARPEGAHGDLGGGQRSSEVKWGKLCAMATIFGQKKP